MQINSPSENRITVELTAPDMRELDITYEEMDYASIETRRVIWTVLDAAGKHLGRELDLSRRMLIEASPLAGGGCALTFTLLDTAVKPRRPTLIKQAGNLICDFESLDCLFDAAKQCKTELSIKSRFYENNGRYRLVINSPFDLSLLEHRLCEFAKCRRCENLEVEHIREHWSLLAEGNALNILQNKNQL
jgi:negative regulator of genetic competence, sporulation and motility